MTWPEKELLYADFVQKLGAYADEMVALLSAHGEENWTRIYARFGDDIRRAKTDKARQKAIQEIESIYGGMGSWNDFYLQALGEAESKRTSLSTAISHQCSALSDLMAQPPYPPKTGLWQSFLRYLGT